MSQIGDIVDQYRLTEHLGTGTFGEVWKARRLGDHAESGVTCAVKLMRLTDDPVGRSSRSFGHGWREEVNNLMRVAGDAIPRIYEANVWNDYAYIAMELLEGSTLRARLDHGAVPWRRALFIADQIARALEAAHAVGIIHRDLKPQNVILQGASRVCVIDWGIARSRTVSRSIAGLDENQPGAGAGPMTDVGATDVSGMIPLAAPRAHTVTVGTPGYMAPELYEHAPLDVAQDVYALGVVLYELIAGCLPHALAPLPTVRSVDAMRAYRTSLDKATMDYAFVPLRERCPGVPRGVAALVESLLARDPERRPRQLRQAIELASRFPHGVPDPPYVGLGELGLEHGGLYFGQETTVRYILERLATQRGVLLWGPSGSGKSSLAVAGVAATMDRTLFLDTDGWELHVIRPLQGQGVRAVTRGGSTGPRAIGHVVVIDQLEEVVDLDPESRDAFCAAILALLEQTGPVMLGDTRIDAGDKVRVIATIRDDLEWRVDREVPALLPLLAQRVIVQGVDPNIARTIIESPPLALGYRVEGIDVVSGEVQMLLSRNAASLPVVQYALSEWWSRRNDARKLLPLAGWKDLGGVGGVLSSVAEGLFARLRVDDQRRVQALFVRLFRGDRKQPLAEAGLMDDDRRLLEELMRLRLVGRRANKGSLAFYEVEHESLVEHWSRLSEWLLAAREEQALIDDLERDAAAHARAHDPERLWRGRRLSAATEMAGRDHVALTESARQFLRQSRWQERWGRFVRWALAVGAALILGTFYVWSVAAAASSASSGARETAERAAQELAQTQQDLALMQQDLALRQQDLEWAQQQLEEANAQKSRDRSAADEAAHQAEAARADRRAAKRGESIARTETATAVRAAEVARREAEVAKGEAEAAKREEAVAKAEAMAAKQEASIARDAAAKAEEAATRAKVSRAASERLVAEAKKATKDAEKAKADANRAKDELAKAIARLAETNAERAKANRELASFRNTNFYERYRDYGCTR